MLKVIRSFFEALSKIDRFLRCPYRWGMNGFTFLFISIIVLGAIGMKIDDYFGTEIFMKSSTFLFGSFIYCLIPYLFYKGEGINKFILFGKKEGIEEITKRFDLKGYMVFLLFFSYFLVIPIVGIPLLLQIFEITFLIEFILSNMELIIFILIAITSFMWFSFHIIKSIVCLQKVKVKVSLYTASGSSLTLLKINELEQFLIVVSCLVISYSWVQYIIELKTEEDMNKKQC